MGEIERLNEVLKSVFIKIGIYKKADMAEYLGYKSPYFSGIINGKEKLSETFLKNISEKLDVNIDYILEGKGGMLKSEENIPSELDKALKEMSDDERHIVMSNAMIGVLDKLIGELRKENKELNEENKRLIEQNGYYQGLLDRNGIQYKKAE